MARSFNGSSDNLTATSAALSALPGTLHCRCKPANTTNNMTMLSLSSSSDDDPLYRIAMTSAGKARAQYRGDTGSAANADSSTTLSTTAWQAITATFNSSGHPEIFYNGASENSATGTLDTNFTGNRTTIGVLTRTSSSQYFEGEIDEYAIWNIVLSDEDIASLGNGASPGMVRRDALVSHWRVYGVNSPEPDHVGGIDLTVSGTTAAAHGDRLLYQRTLPEGYDVVAAAGGGNPAWHHHRPMLLGGVGA